jgi:uncharacterized protein (DUF736 family)
LNACWSRAVNEAAQGGLGKPKGDYIMAYNIGFFKKTDTGFAGKIETLAFKTDAAFHRVLTRTNQNAPAFEIFAGDLRIGAAWERQGQNGNYLSVSFEDPSFSSGYYNLYQQRGVEGHVLTFERPRAKKDAVKEAA